MKIVRNFFQNGLTSVDTSVEFEAVFNRRGVQTGDKVTVRCSPDHDCTWDDRGPVPASGEPGHKAGLEPGDVYAVRMPNPDGLPDPYYEVHNFAAVRKEVEVPEVVDYVDVSQQDVDAQRDPKGTVPAGPRSRTATYSVPGHLTCGDLFGQAYVWTVKDELLVATYYVEVYSRDDNGDVVVPFVVTGCVLRDPDEPYHPIVEQVDANGDTVIDSMTNLPELVKASEPQMRGGRPVTAGEVLPATRAPVTDCSMLEGTPRGSECVVTYHEYTSPDAAGEVPRPATGRLASVTHPGDAPEYEPPTEREVEACNRRSDHETCINKLEADALNDYYRALEAHDAKVQRYEQELDNLAYDIDDDPATPETLRGEPFWVCTSYEQWKRDVEEGYTTGQRCYLVG
ncbi:MAG: hypothetical protein F4110_01965 [Acidimicrobiaceae bacterium]|nr:hypothetical protein [Acidimicrobiaceae bacterium]